MDDWPHLEGLELADPLIERSSSIELILGAEVYACIIEEGIRKGPRGTPIAQRTSLGWILSGLFSDEPLSRTQRIVGLECTVDHELLDLLRRFVVQEDTPTAPLKYTLDDEECEKLFISTYQRAEDGRYIVRLPIKDRMMALGDSRSAALRMFMSLERRLQRDPTLHQSYTRSIQEYAYLGEMDLVTDPKELEPTQGYFLPHHCVIKESSTSTKVRPVFNASQRTNLGISMNELLHAGPKLQTELQDVILRWRCYPIVFTADIEKMFRRIWIHPEDRIYQKILWRTHPGEELRTYRLKTVTFGFASSPYLAIRTLHQLSDDEGINFPLARDILRKEIYVDDVFSGAYDIETALEKRHQIYLLLKAGGFILKKWLSNYEDVLQDVPEDCKEKASSYAFTQEPIHKTLGILWQPVSDSFRFQFKISEESGVPTKRSVFSEIARLFDPLGWLAPVSVRAKIFMQSLWRIKLGWDQPLPADHITTWRKYRRELPELSTLSIPRWLGCSSDVSGCELHGFGDASEKAIAAVVYLRILLPSNETRVSLISAKTKVARLKETSLPRLELCAAVLLVRLMDHVRSVLSLPSLVPIHLWSDSANTLDWIRGQPLRWTTYISNRVSEIQTVLPDAIWHHVPGVDNPADCASRGISPLRLEAHPLWWTGPTWLAQESTFWPSTTGSIAPDIDREERVVVHSTTTDLDPPWSLLGRYSSLTKLVRITALCLRFIDRLRRKHSDLSIGTPNPEELKRARCRLLGYEQRRHFTNEMKLVRKNLPVAAKSPLFRLWPFLDSDGLLRLGGRLKHATLEFDERCPYILPKDSLLTNLIIWNGHQAMLHGGTQLTLSYIRRQYWIIAGRRVTKKVLARCVICARYRAKTHTQLMGQLPIHRVIRPPRPFSTSGVDYAGPIWIRTTKGRGYKAYKGYIVVFVCFATRAVHLEACSDYTADGFIAAYKRFIARRGVSAFLYSDCGTNFVGADKQLRTLFKEASAFSTTVSRHLADDGTTWRFNPPAAPHFGGLWEAAVRSVKHHLRRVMGDTTLTFEEMATFLTQVEACLNSRPLQAQSDDPNDLEPLTPSHFLIGSPIFTVPEPSLIDINQNRLTRWQLVRQMYEDFWNRWSSEYLQGLQTRPKWQKPMPSLKIGDLVLVSHENLPPTKWARGRVIATRPDAEGHVRSVTLRTAHGTMERPIVKLCVLPVHPIEDEPAVEVDQE